METPYPSQLALSASTNSSDPTSTSDSASSRLSASTSSPTSNLDEPRQSRKRTATEQEEEDREDAGVPSQREIDFESGIEQGSSARPRTILRRSRTTQPVNNGGTGSRTARRASSSSFTEGQWIRGEQSRSEEGAFRGVEDLASSQWAGSKRHCCERSGRSVDSNELVEMSSVSPPPSLSPRPSLSSAPLDRSASLPSTKPSPSEIASINFRNHPLSPSLPPTASCSRASFPSSVSPALPCRRMSDPLPSSPRSRSSSVPLGAPSPQSAVRASFPPSRLVSGLMASQDNANIARNRNPLTERQGRARPTGAAFRASPSVSYGRSSMSSGASEDASPAQLLSQSDLIKIHIAQLSRRGTDAGAPLVSASLSPPISRNTLRELDLHEVMRNAQLRHDVVFDPNLMFRPNFDGERGERKRLAAEQYWTAVSREISRGCRCSTFSDSGVLPCVCSRGSKVSNSTFVVPTSRLPTRIVTLVAELRGILLSLLPATAPSSPTPPSTAVFSAASTLPSSIPQPAPPLYGPREQLIDALDPILVSKQLVQGDLDVANLARFLGSTLKTHCAPMRDELVDEMVAACEGRDGVVKGLRMCFEILELMKLDIANHQLRSLRPYLLQTSVEFERRFFDGANTRTSDASAVPHTTAWIEGIVETLGHEKLDSAKDPSKLVDKTVTRGVLDLVFSSSFVPPALPETLQLDAFRLAHFHCDATDLTIVYMLTLLYQQLSFPARPSPADVDTLRHELWCIISENTGSFPSLVDSPASVVGIPSGPAGQGVAKLEDKAWRQSMQDAVFQIAARAQQAKLRHEDPSSSSSSTEVPTPDRQLVALAQGYFDANARPHSKVFQILSQRLRETLEMVVGEELGKEKSRGDFEYLGWWAPASGGVTMRTGSRRAALGTGGGGGSDKSFAPSSAMMASTETVTQRRGTKRSASEESEEAVAEKRQKMDRSPSISVRHRTASSNDFASRFDAVLSRNGLTALAGEIKVLGDRITKVTSFNLTLFRPLYENLLSLSHK